VSDSPRVVAIVLNWNREDDTIEAVRSLERSSLAFETICVADNASRPESREAIRRAGGNAHLIENSGNLGYAGGNNRALQWALEQGADYCLVLNNDATVDPEMLGVLVEVAERDPNIAVLGPRVYRADAPGALFYTGWKIDWKKWLFHRVPTVELAPGERVADVDYVQGCAMMIRAGFLREHGCFDERYHLYCEDADLCVRAQRAGFRTVEVPEARAWHKGYGSSGQRSPLKTYYGLRNRLLFIAKHAPKENRFGLTARLLVFDAGGNAWRAVREIARGDAAHGWATLRALGRALLDAVRGRYGAGPRWLFERSGYGVDE
jgi:GT2 family glycosyltransferase